MWPTIIVGIILLLFVVLAVRSIMKNKAKGGCCGCSGCSGHCGQSCGHGEVSPKAGEKR
ncbi:MAG: FeoB-associated Cys-rich membrane protein [Massiliimalia sp.]|jgi:hypothetical protein